MISYRPPIRSPRWRAEHRQLTFTFEITRFSASRDSNRFLACTISSKGYVEELREIETL